jgi:hypothetical protein
MLDDPARLKHMAAVKAPLQMVYYGKIENLHFHIQDFIRQIQNIGLYKEFAIRTQENHHPDDIKEEDWTIDHPLHGMPFYKKKNLQHPGNACKCP